MNTIHKFEERGLGKAPFTVFGVEHRVGPIRTVLASGVTVQVGAPGQPMGTCDYCGQEIAQCWMIRSSDGKEFVVGCDCVRKTNDEGLKRAMAPYKRKLKHARDDARIAAAKSALKQEHVRAALSAKPSPNKRRPQDSALTFVEWMLSHAGRAGSIKACRVVEALASEA